MAISSASSKAFDIFDEKIHETFFKILIPANIIANIDIVNHYELDG